MHDTVWFEIQGLPAVSIASSEFREAAEAQRDALGITNARVDNGRGTQLDLARARGLVAVDGLGMLLHQARPGFEAWFGVAPQVDQALRDVVAADIPKRDGA